MNCIILHIPPTLFKIFFLLQPFTMGMCYSIPKCSTITTVTELFPARGPCEALARPASHMPAFRSPDTELFCMAVSTEATKMTFPSGESFQPSGRNVPGKHLVTSYSHHNLRHCTISPVQQKDRDSWRLLNSPCHVMKIVSAKGTRGLK